MCNGSYKDGRAKAAFIAACASIAPVCASSAPSWGNGLDGKAPADDATHHVGDVHAHAQLQEELAASLDALLPGRQIKTSVAAPNPLVARALLSFDPEARSTDEVWDDHEVASSLAFGPLVASTLVPGISVTVVASRSDGEHARTVHALIRRPGELVSWIRLPFEDLPEAVFVISPFRTIYLTTSPDGLGFLTAIDNAGRIVGQNDLHELLPARSLRTQDPVSLVATPTGACLTVPLACGTLALVETGTGDPSEAEEGFQVCSVVLSDKHACGVDAWLTQAREMSRAGDTEAALYALEAAVETDPNDARGYRELAMFHRRRGEVQAQLDCLHTGVVRLHEEATGVADYDWQIGTPAARLTIDYVTAVRAAKDLDLAYEAVDLVMDLYPCMEQVVLFRAELFLEEGKLDEAIESLRLALGEVDPNSDLAAAYHDTGRFLCRHGNTEAAVIFLEDAYALGDQSEFLIRGLASASVKLGQPARAAEWLTVLAKRWRTAQNGESDSERAERASKRLTDLEAEIAGLVSAADKSDD